MDSGVFVIGLIVSFIITVIVGGFMFFGRKKEASGTLLVDGHSHTIFKVNFHPEHVEVRFLDEEPPSYSSCNPCDPDKAEVEIIGHHDIKVIWKVKGPRNLLWKATT